MHTISINHPILEPRDGLLLGNGDLSVSIYQKPNQIVWRFGKNDVWDRRLDLSDSPRPSHIDEIAAGIRDEGWTSHGFIDGQGKALHGTNNEKRMQELCDGPPAYAKRPYPCPKPVGELAMHLPVDLPPMQIDQRLTIEEGLITIICRWPNGVKVHVACFIPPTPNVLVVRWHIEGWTNKTATGSGPPVRFSLYRWSDPTIEAYAARLYAETGFKYFEGVLQARKSKPLSAPETDRVDDQYVIRQQFYPDLSFKDGFKYVLAPINPHIDITPVDMTEPYEARLHLIPQDDALNGWLITAMGTSTDEGGAEAEIRRVARSISDKGANAVEAWAQDSIHNAESFWRRSSVSVDNQIMEQTWYETLHARRCAFRPDVIAPGLAMPSTVQDYSLWHGDYHTNYNYQSPFWGDLTANHLDLSDAFYPGMAPMIHLGRKLARDYWSCRGTFIQLSGYPFEIEDDPYGTGPLCRMAYMTGWIANHYWWRYRYTLDRGWLEDQGYPVLRDCALFYTDFLKSDEEGTYHAFPSGQGEYFYTGKAEDYTDRPQVIRHVRYCLNIALQAAQILDSDESFQNEWQDRLDHLVVVDDPILLKFSSEEKHRYILNAPEFTAYDVGHIPRPEDAPVFLQTTADNALWRNYFGQFPWALMIHLRNRAYHPERDYAAVCAFINKWRRPNGTIRAMSEADYGYIGVYTESQGILAPLQEMMLQSWDGVIRLFPAWPTHINASFTTFRAEGAFLVSAIWEAGGVKHAEIVSECGGICRFAGFFSGQMVVQDDGGSRIPYTIQDDVFIFETTLGGRYRIGID